MKNVFLRRCKKCESILRFLEKNKIEVFDTKCKTCKRTYNITETKDL